MDKLYKKPRDVNLYGNAISPKSYGVYYKYPERMATAAPL